MSRASDETVSLAPSSSLARNTDAACPSKSGPPCSTGAKTVFQPFTTRASGIRFWISSAFEESSWSRRAPFT
jgi:hypothetical protein